MVAESSDSEADTESDDTEEAVSPQSPTNDVQNEDPLLVPVPE